LNNFPISGRFAQHALVVIEMNEDSVTVYDPAVRECRLPMDKFIAAWRLQRNLTILILP
jgi:predicted double-glycine peptidase